MPYSPAQQVHVLWAERSDLPSVPAWLSPAEAERAARKRPDVRREWVAARCWVRARLGERLEIDPADVPIGRDEDGRSFLDVEGAPAISISHCRGVVALAVSNLRSPIGVDVEEIPGPELDLREIAAVVATPGELDELSRVADHDLPLVFQRWWTRKEALLKGLGTGFLQDPQRVVVGTRPEATPPRPWRLHEHGPLDLPGRPVITLATMGPATTTYHR